ncbi:hypothetical protein EVAR_76243_1 [Eumeta japonica]|uniref:Uncharacterized protein n=1 Tax=Eumeta variegata TaxID=151549 RepID=A0A4C1UNX9_EUMVA|nr:hypothetical protein EVAR_76243_1 [Eumeta japonica]
MAVIYKKRNARQLTEISSVATSSSILVLMIAAQLPSSTWNRRRQESTVEPGRGATSAGRHTRGDTRALSPHPAPRGAPAGVGCGVGETDSVKSHIRSYETAFSH